MHASAHVAHVFVCVSEREREIERDGRGGVGGGGGDRASEREKESERQTHRIFCIQCAIEEPRGLSALRRGAFGFCEALRRGAFSAVAPPRALSAKFKILPAEIPISIAP